MEPKMRSEEVIALINNYRKLECLWNFRSPKYKKVDLKNKAWLHLSIMFNKDVAEVKKKIKYLRSAYVNEKKKVDESKLTGVTDDELYRPKLFYYDDLNFLDPVIVLRQNSSIYESNSSPHMELEEVEEAEEVDIKQVETNDYCLEYVSMPSPSPSFSTSTQDKQEKHRLSPSSYSSFKLETTTDEPITYSAPSSEHDKLYQAFGKTVAMQLGQLTPLEANSTMDVIHRLVSRDVMRSLLARTKPKLASTPYEHPYFKRKRHANN